MAGPTVICPELPPFVRDWLLKTGMTADELRCGERQVKSDTERQQQIFTTIAAGVGTLLVLRLLSS